MLKWPHPNQLIKKKRKCMLIFFLNSKGKKVILLCILIENTKLAWVEVQKLISFKGSVVNSVFNHNAKYSFYP
jgi:hypothetical protein